MSKLLITDELDHSKVVDIYPRGGLEIVPFYDYAYLPSSTGSGVAVSASCWLHSIIVSNTGASGSYLVLSDQGDTAEAVPSEPGESASAVAKIYLGSRKRYIYDILINNTLCYLLSGQHTVSGNPNNDGITIMYKLVS